MPTGLPTRLETLLEQVAALYSATTVPAGVSADSAAALLGLLPLFPPERVYLTLAGDEVFASNAPADQFLVIRPEAFDAIDGLVAGGGNTTLGTEAKITVTLWNRFEADLPLSDAAAITDATFGILTKWRACSAILSQFMPTDNNGNGLALEPIRFIRWTTQQHRTGSPWLLLQSDWQIRFVQSLD